MTTKMKNNTASVRYKYSATVFKRFLYMLPRLGTVQYALKHVKMYKILADTLTKDFQLWGGNMLNALTSDI